MCGIAWMLMSHQVIIKDCRHKLEDMQVRTVCRAVQKRVHTLCLLALLSCRRL